MGKQTAIRHRLNVVFDTNALYTQRIDDPVNDAAAEVIKAHSKHVDVEITWSLPEMVVREREYQMLDEAKKYVVSLNKIERLLGTNWNVTPENLELQIQKSIQNRMHQLGLVMVPLNPAPVDWQRLTTDAARRVPPFEAGDTEKGFKDAIIIETFLQIMAAWLAEDIKNKAYLVTSDKVMTEALQKRLPPGNRVRIFADMSALSSEINILGSSVDETFAAELVADATTLFFDPASGDGFFNQAQIDDEIARLFPEYFRAPKGSIVVSKSTTVSNPVFVSKTSRKVAFTSRVTFEIEVRQRPPTAIGNLVPMNVNVLPGSELSLTRPNVGWVDLHFEHTTGQLKTWDLASTATVVPAEWNAEGKSLNGTLVVDVDWEANLTKSKKLSAPHVKEIRAVQAGWSKQSR